MRTPLSSPPSSLSNCTSSSAAAVAAPSPASASSSTPCFRCQGLDLLAMAALEVAGVDRGAESSANGKDSSKEKLLVVVVKEEGGSEGVEGSRPKRRRQMVTPSRFQDSILQPWKRQTRRRRLSSPAK